MWLTVCTVGTFDNDMANKLIKIMFNKYLKFDVGIFPILIEIKIIFILISQ